MICGFVDLAFESDFSRVASLDDEGGGLSDGRPAAMGALVDGQYVISCVAMVCSRELGTKDTEDYSPLRLSCLTCWALKCLPSFKTTT